MSRALLMVAAVAAAACSPAPTTPPPHRDLPARTTPRPPAAPAPAARPAAGADLADEVRLLHRLAACAGDAPIPAALPSEIVASHCRNQRAVYRRFRQKVLPVAAPFLAALRPSRLPPAVVYPFGGGDLLFALTAFPEATEITTISLERAGDIRAVAAIPAAALGSALRDVAWMTMRLAIVEYSFTTHMGAMQRSRLPVQLALALAALAIHELEPISLRYFRIASDGSLRYLNRTELATYTPPPPRPRQRRRRAKAKAQAIPELPETFANVEIAFRPVAARGPVRIYRHIAANLDDRHLRADPSLLRHLEGKGRVAAMTKAGSYLLWLDSFSLLRNYLLARMDWMVSDSTGILPRHAIPAGFEQIPYGRFKRSLLGTAQDANLEMGKLWRSRKHQPLPFHFGYPDFDNRSAHLLVTRRRGAR